jgi:putative FmdB family regulatory protein
MTDSASKTVALHKSVTRCFCRDYWLLISTLPLCLTATEVCLTFALSQNQLDGKLLDAERQMPIYEYECQTCGHRFEEWQKMSDEPVKVCPKCKKRKVEKLISHTSFQLKGGGWYSDLYSSQKPGSSAESSSGSAKSDSAGKSESPGGESSSTSTPASEGKGKGKGKKGAKAAA